MQKINLLSALILFGTLQGVILSVALNNIKKKNRTANRILAVFIFLISITLLSRLVYVEGVSIVNKYPHLYLIPDIPMFLYGPLFYFYIKSLLNKDAISIRKVWPHFIPALIHILIMSVYLFESRMEYAQRLMENNLIELPWAPYLAILQSGIYIVYSYAIYKRYLGRIKDNLSFRFSLRYLHIIFILIFICWLAWLISALGPAVQSITGFEYIDYNIAWVALSFTTFSLAYFAIIQQDIFKLDVIPVKYERSGLSSEQLDALKEKLSRCMDSQKPYLNPKITLNDLSGIAEIPAKDLSRLINERFSVNFFDFVNMYRIREFKELSKKDNYKNMTILAAAFDAGFNSKTTFNTAFKKHTNTTPAEFVKNSS
jgi:AraC-like DNA-binding protein